jgi:hypothetical protein
MGEVAGAVKTFKRSGGRLDCGDTTMTYLKFTETKDGFAVVLNPELEQLLGAAPGGEVAVKVSEDGTVTLVGRDMSPEARRERGRAFIKRYQQTFEALAK